MFYIIGILFVSQYLAASDPVDFPDVTVRVPADIQGARQKIQAFLNASDEGQVFLTEVFPQGLPINVRDFTLNNPKQKYASWYNSRHAVSAASAQQIEEERNVKKPNSVLFNNSRLKC